MIHITRTGVLLGPSGNTLTQRESLFISSPNIYASDAMILLFTSMPISHLALKMVKQAKTIRGDLISSSSLLSRHRLNELPYFIIQSSKGQIMSNSLNLVSKSITALKALLHGQFYLVAMTLLSGQLQSMVTVLGGFD